jgi:MscS family membrane protein
MYDAMAGNSTSIISDVGNSSIIQGIENSVVQATGVSQTWADIIVAVAIVIISFILARAAKYFIVKIAPGLVSRTRTSLDDEILKAINGPLQVSIIAVGIYAAFATINHLPGLVSDNMAAILTIALIYIGAYLLSNLAKALINWYKTDVAPRTESELDDVLIPFLSKVIGIIIFILASLMVLAIFNIDITPLVATLGVGGIAVALAAQELLSNVFGAIAVLSDRPYKVGDRVEVSSGMVGDVIEIGLRSTRLKTLDNRLIVIPNSDISKSNIINYSLPDSKVRFDINVGIAYDADVEKATRILLDIAGNTDVVLKDPAPGVYVKELGNFSVNLIMYVWTNDYRLCYEIPDRIYRKTLTRFKAENIEIPFPVTSVILNKPQTGVKIEVVNPPIKR